MKIKTKALATMALLAALSAVAGVWNIYWSPTSRTSLNFIPYSLAGTLFPPFWAGLVGLAGDIAGYLAKPVGAYFPGYSLSAVVTTVIYALFLYNRPVRLWRVACAQLVILLVVSFGLNALWAYINAGTGGAAFYSAARLVKSLIEYPVQVALITCISKYAQRYLKRDEK